MEELRELAERALERLPHRDEVEAWPAARHVLACSEFVAGVLAAEPAAVADLSARDWSEPMSRADYDRSLAALLDGTTVESDIGPALRRFRRIECARIAWRDLAGLAPIEIALGELSDLADACITAAWTHTEAQTAARYGSPRSREGVQQHMVVLALGKLGARELNFSSDVDLIFSYPENGDTDGERSISNEEFFTRQGRALIRLLDQATTDGFVYRVDMRLRPFGEAGPLVSSFGALESYYQEHGRDWERYALVKARPVTGERVDGEHLLDLLRPFVYRRYLDYGSFEQLRRMKGMIEQEVAKRELADNIKLGPGGIREIEFIGQAYQLIRGGREPALQARGILRVLDLLAARKHLDPSVVGELKDAYRWLRQVENRMQAQADQQVHVLPGSARDRARLAAAMGHPDWAAFRAEFDAIRTKVQRRFSAVFFGPRQTEETASGIGQVWRNEEAEDAASRLAEAGFAEPAEVLVQLAQFREGAGYRMLGDAGRARLDRLMPLVIEAASTHDNADETLMRCLRIIEAIDRRIAYFSLLIESPTSLEHLARLCSASSMIAARVARAPLLLDELLDARIFNEAPTREEFEQDLARMLEGVPADDLERRMDMLRAFQQAAILRVAVADVVGLLPLMRVSDFLTDIAEICLAEALELAWRQLVARHGRPKCGAGDARREAGFGIVAYGKLGGIELAYGSDLDLVFLHDSEGDEQVTDGERPLENAVFFARLGQRIVHILSTPTAAGILYEVDTRLRPSGTSGLLVTSLAAFGAYQREQAWTWEHQALLRARPVAGSDVVATAFKGIRCAVLTRARDIDTLRGEVAEMRARMRRELAIEGAGRFDLKQGEGGIADIEFLVQYLVLRHAHAHPALLDWSDNIRQLDGLMAAGVLDADSGLRLADAYRALRERVHRLGLQGLEALADDGEFAEERRFVTGLWQEHLESAGV